MAQLIKPQIKWTEDKIKLLKQNYPLSNKKELAIKLGIKYKTLKHAARRFGVKSLQDKKFYKLKFLYEESILSYYWMGFIMADGHITNSGQLSITLSEKDKNHLKKIADILKVNLHTNKKKTDYKVSNYSTITVQDTKYGKLLLDKWGLSGPKTYNPPTKMNFSNQKYFLSFLIGYIDGDGTFSKGNKTDCDFIRIELHKSWLKPLQEFEIYLHNLGILNTRTGLNSRFFSYLKIYKHQNLVFLKTFALAHNLPILERKWDSVNLNRILKIDWRPKNNLDQKLLF